MDAVSDVIDLWPSASDFAADLGVRITMVHVWRHRKSIPIQHWASVESAAAKRSIVGASASDLARLASRRRPDPDAAPAVTTPPPRPLAPAEAA